MESAFNAIELLLKESENLLKLAREKANSSVIDGEMVNYSSLRDRVNSVGTSLAEIKSELAEIGREKKELMEIVEKMEKMEPQKLAAILNR